jgi:hypothetical protein
MAEFSMEQPEYWVYPEAIMKFEGLRTAQRLLGEGRSVPRILILDMQPGFVINRHYHDCERFEMIVKGSLYSGDGMLHVGAVMTAHAGELYGPKVAGPEGCMSVEVFAETSDPVFELDDGSLFFLNPTSGQELPKNLAQSDWIEEHRAMALDGVTGPVP